MRGQETGQFGSFDGRDNRKTVMDLFVRFGHNRPEAHAAAMRAAFLQGLMDHSTNCFAGKMVQVSPCSAVEAYHLFVAITGCLGVPVEKAARTLEMVVRSA